MASSGTKKFTARKLPHRLRRVGDERAQHVARCVLVARHAGTHLVVRILGERPEHVGRGVVVEGDPLTDLRVRSVASRRSRAILLPVITGDGCSTAACSAVSIAGAMALICANRGRVLKRMHDMRQR